jgi:exodeoxyribonuclease VII small subunit
MARTTRKTTTGDQPFVYEDAIAQIESIIDRIESGEAGLDETIQQCEAGLKLIGRCRGVLDATEKRIAELTADEDGQLHVQAEDDDEADEDDDEPADDRA